MDRGRFENGKKSGRENYLVQLDKSTVYNNFDDAPHNTKEDDCARFAQSGNLFAHNFDIGFIDCHFAPTNNACRILTDPFV
jgi:hypothetical protein